jgi:PAS domain S-box-containing protein
MASAIERISNMLQSDRTCGSLKRDGALFFTFLLLGAVAANTNVNIPNTQAYFELRWAFGFMGVALIRRTWLAFLLACLLSISLISDTSLQLAFLGNMMYGVPCFLLIRLVHGRWMQRMESPVAYGAAWFALVAFMYEILITPMVWGLLTALKGRPFVEGAIEGFSAQPYLVEMLLTALISSFGMVAFRIHADLRASEERFRLLSEAASVGLMIHRDGRLLNANQAFCDIFGCSADALREPGRNVIEATIAPEEQERVRRLQGEGGPQAYETEGIREDGERFPIQVVASPVEYDGMHAHATAVTDMTEKKRLQERVEQSQKLEALGQLAGGVAHDFNNQLGGILGYAELLNLRLTEPALKEYVNNILLCARRAGDLTSQLLAFARRGKYQSVPVDLHECIREVIGILERSMDKRIRVIQRLEAEHAVTSGDPTLLQNALLNLAINARDAMPDGGELIFDTKLAELDGEYCASLPYDVQPGRFVRVCVTDTGTGIPREIESRIFEPFFTTKEVNKGTGMGLAAVHGTIKQHGGAINIYSEPGHGTTFRLYLPLCAKLPEATRREEAVTPARGPACVLVVEDEDVLRALAGEMLTDAGYTVRMQSDGPGAIAYYREHREEIDLVLLDMVMPDMGGQETFQALRTVDPEVRVVLASGYSINGAAQSLLDQGVRGFVQKPFTQAKLTRCIAEALDNTA